MQENDQKFVDPANLVYVVVSNRKPHLKYDEGQGPTGLKVTSDLHICVVACA